MQIRHRHQRAPSRGNVGGASVSTAAGVTGYNGHRQLERRDGTDRREWWRALSGTNFKHLLYAGAGDTITGNFTANGLMNAGSGTLVMSGN